MTFMRRSFVGLLIIAASALALSGCRSKEVAQPQHVVTLPDPDPPIIIHGGSFRTSVRTATTNLALPFFVRSLKVNSVVLSAAYLNGGSNPVLPPFWQVNVCDDQGCTTGLKICSADEKGTCLTTNGTAATVSVMPLGTVTMDASDMPDQFEFERRNKLHGKENGKATELHPGYVQILQNGKVLSNYTCASVASHDDWASCWVAFGDDYQSVSGQTIVYSSGVKQP